MTSFPALADGAWLDLTFEPFRPGVEIARLYGDAKGGPSGAILKYAPGSETPRHRHAGYETIVVLEGSQSDASGTYRTGDVVVNPPGTMHKVTSKAGCVVLIVWQEPVEILEP